MKSVKSIIVLIVIAFAALASAEFYRYTDNQGNVHYTDDLSSVPADQQPKVDKYEGSDSESIPEKQPEANKEEKEASKGSPAEMGEENAGVPSLRERGAKLDAEYSALMQEREQLEEAGQESLTPATRAELREKIIDFNERMQDYEKRKDAFNQEVEAYNAGLKGETPPPEAEKE